MINSYFPNENEEKFNFIQNMYKYVMSNLPIIWGGDFNLTEDNTIDRWPERAGHDTHFNHLKHVFETFNLVDVCRVFLPIQRVYTFKRTYNGNVVRSRIDRLMSTKHFDLLAYEQYDCEFSDQEIISIQIQYQSKLVFGQGTCRNNTKIYNCETITKA